MYDQNGFKDINRYTDALRKEDTDVSQKKKRYRCISDAIVQLNISA